MVAVAHGQGRITGAEQALEMAERHRVTLRLYVGWGDWLRECAFWGPCPEREAVSRISARVFERAKRLEVSLGGLQHWVRLATLAPSGDGEIRD